MIYEFLSTLQHYVLEVLPALALGLFLSGLVHEFVPQDWVNKHLNQRGIRPLLYSTFAGIILPLCCFGSLPIAIGFRKKGVPLGPILAFLVATPATSITAILVTWRLMGISFTVYLCLSVVLISLTLGLIGNRLVFSPVAHETEECPQCAEGEHINHRHHQKGIRNRIVSILSFGFLDIMRDIGLELIIGLILAAAVASLAPIGTLIETYLSAGLGYLFALIFGLVMYICSTASVPLVHALVSQGLNIGPGLILLLVGPVTSYGTILVIRKEFGTNALLVYLAVICSSALILGYIYSLILGF